MKKNQLPKKHFTPLDKEEANLMNMIDNDEFNIVPNAKELMKQAVLIAKATQRLRKNKVVTFRIAEYDLNELKIKAKNQGLPYQTLLSSLVHQYNQNKMKVNI